MMTVSFMTLFYSMQNGKEYSSYTIIIYIVIIVAYFCPLQEKVCQHARKFVNMPDDCLHAR